MSKIHHFWHTLRFFFRREITSRRLVVVVWFFLIASLPWARAQWESTRPITIAPPSTELILSVLPEAGVKPVIDFVNEAKSSLDVNVYLLSDRAVLAALGQAQQRGVRVRVMFEHEPFGGAFLTKKTRDNLLASGIAVKDGPRRFTYNHAKYVVRDDSTALISTANFTTAAFERDRDFIIFDRDPSDVEMLSQLFAADWESASWRGDDPELVISPDNAQMKLISLIQQARTEIVAGVEVFDDEQLRQELGAAETRGVEVRILLADANDIAVNGRSGDDLVQRGVVVRYQTKPILHAKYLVVDGRAAYLGSVNFTTNSLTANREVGLLTVAPNIIQALRQWFEIDWAAAVEKISFSCWQECGILQMNIL